jgi:molybdate transport system substrate-binding protein
VFHLSGDVRRTGFLVLAMISFTLFFLFAPRGAAQTKETRVLASDGVKAPVEDLRAQCERAMGHALAVEFDTAASLKSSIEAGKPFDVAILTSEAIKALVTEGKIADSTRTDVARAGIGIGFRAGASKPDISTPDALKQTLLRARSITMNKNGASATYVEKVFSRLGITEQIKPKLMLEQEAGRPQMNVADGKAELVITLIPEIPVFRGVELAGPLPAALQSYIGFTAGVAINSHDPKGAQTLVKFLSGPEAAAAFKARGLEPRHVN